MKLGKIQREQEAFDSQLEAMAEEHAGQFVVFHDGVSAGYYPTYDAAYQEALKRFGLDQTFLVSEVKKRGPELVSISWQNGLMFNRG